MTNIKTRPGGLGHDILTYPLLTDTTGKTAATATIRARLYFADYLRAALVCLVILHHTAITYGGLGSFYYTEPATSPVSAGLLTLFVNFNQAWFLGAFFMLSGYFTPSAFDRKGIWRFLKDRLIRLGNSEKCTASFAHSLIQKGPCFAMSSLRN